jgi:hypothetical protein
MFLNLVQTITISASLYVLRLGFRVHLTDSNIIPGLASPKSSKLPGIGRAYERSACRCRWSHLLAVLCRRVCHLCLTRLTVDRVSGSVRDREVGLPFRFWCGGGFFSPNELTPTFLLCAGLCRQESSLHLPASSPRPPLWSRTSATRWVQPAIPISFSLNQISAWRTLGR